MRIAHPNIFLKRNIITVFIQEIVLQYVERLDFLHVNLLVVLPSPFSCNGEESLGEIGEDERMNLQRHLSLVLVEEQVFEAVFYLVDVNERRLDLACSVANRTFFLDDDFRCRAHTLTCDLDEPEFCSREDGVLGAVFRHLFLQLLEQQLAVFSLVHVDEVDDDDAAHVA